MESLPIDPNNPAVREYLALTRLQVLTPLSLVINIATVLVCTVAVSPSLGGVSREKLTALSPNIPAIGTYILFMYVLQVGYCALAVLASKQETKKALVKAVGLSLVLSNFLMAIWAVAWVAQWFLFCTILQGLLLLLLLYSNIALMVYHPPVSSRPFDTMLIHAPLRFFFILVLSVLFPLCLFITLGFFQKSEEHPKSQAWHVWPVFGVILGTNLVGLIIVMLRRDFMWAAAATWICISIWSLKPKPSAILITVIIFTVLHPVAFITAEVYHRFQRSRLQPIVLEGEENHPGLYPPRSEQNGRRPERQPEADSQPQEVTDDNLWTS